MEQKFYQTIIKNGLENFARKKDREINDVSSVLELKKPKLSYSHRSKLHDEYRIYASKIQNTLSNRTLMNKIDRKASHYEESYQFKCLHNKIKRILPCISLSKLRKKKESYKTKLKPILKYCPENKFRLCADLIEYDSFISSTNIDRNNDKSTTEAQTDPIVEPHSTEENIQDLINSTSSENNINSANEIFDLLTHQSLFQPKPEDLNLTSRYKESKSENNTNQYTIRANIGQKQNQSNFQSHKQYSGKISRVVVSRREAFIVPDNFSSKEVECKLRNIINISGEDVTVRTGSKVTYCLSRKRTNDRTPIAKSVFIKSQPILEQCQSTLTQSTDSSQPIPKQWHKGVVIEKKKKYTPFYDIKLLETLPAKLGQDQTVLLPKHLVSGLPLIVRDQVEFTFNLFSMSKAAKCQVICYSSRKLGCIIEFFDGELRKLTDNRHKVIDLLILESMWSFLSSLLFNSVDANVYYVLRFLHFIIELLKVSSPMKSFWQPVINMVFHSVHLNENSDLLSFIDYKNLTRCLKLGGENDQVRQPRIHDLLIEFLELTLKMDSSSANRIVPLLRRISDCFTSQRVQTCLLDVIQSMTVQFCKTKIEVDSWRNESLIPSPEEFKRNLFENDSFLRIVKVGRPYNSFEEYIRTYYCLHRAEGFSAIQKGIDDFDSNRLENTDVNVYHEVALCSNNIINNKHCITLTATLLSKHQPFNTPRRFSSGNLLCLSPAGKFYEEQFWATVLTHDEEDDAVTAELYTEVNSLPDADVIFKLWEYSGRIMLVESQQCFRAIKPVLTSLKNIEEECFPLCDEIVKCLHSQRPSYLEPSTLIDPSPILPNIKEKITVANMFEILNSRTSVLDSSQVDALKYSLLNRLAIIQGPPGCGKTFIGAKIAQIILSCESGTDRPILVLTYKNHALDEFLKHSLDFLNKTDVVRIGDRSKEEALDECNLKHISNDMIPDTLKKNIGNVKRNFENVLLTIEKRYRKLTDSVRMTPEILLHCLDDKQLYIFIKHSKLSIGRKKFKTLSQKILKEHSFKQLMKYVRQSGGSFKNMINDKRNKGEDEKEFEKFAIDLMKCWWPDVNHLKSFQEFRTESKQIDLTRSHRKRLIINKRSSRSDFFRSYKKDLNVDHSEFQIELSDLSFCIGHSSVQSNEQNIWSLNETQKFHFIKSIMKQKAKIHCTRLNSLHEKLKKLRSKKEELELEKSSQMLQSKKIIGVTIVGASIHHSLLRNLSPQVAIVEEAGEILESDLIAALCPSIRHLILIGDHKQLRPNVKTFKLRKKYKFDISMMERLINNQYPYAVLKTQNRMRPEFAELLKDIYPNLENNDSKVELNRPPTCMEKSMFFWTHDSPEISEQSYRNEEEVSRIVNLTRYFVLSGIHAEDITVLGAYLGQTNQLRRDIYLHKECRDVEIATIDNYQGDENEIVIISLVRSNDEENIGFLSELNRRCVAQSRAKCGMYFVGNDLTFRNHRNWKEFINKMEERNCLGSHLGIQCDYHGSLSLKKVRTSGELEEIVLNPTSICSLPCGKNMSCGVTHQCTKTCKSKHSHEDCCILVEFTHPRCGHTGTKMCSQNKINILCESPCESKMDCGVHACSRRCGEPHNHLTCSEMIKYVFPLCGHLSNEMKECSQLITWKCKKEIIVTGQCGHDLIKLCSDKDPKCTETCLKTKKCGHQCTNFCGDNCEDTPCDSCLTDKIKQLKAEKDKARRRIEQINNEYCESREDNRAVLTEISYDGEDSAEYQTVEDLVMKFIKPEHNWYPTITKIQRIVNLKLERNYEEAKLTMHKIYEVDKFHGTDSTAIEKIIHSGFRLPLKSGMFGKGIYFATDSSKSAQTMYTKGSNKLLLCRVLLGRSLVVEKDDNTLTWNKINLQGYDSVFAKRGTKSIGGVLNDEFVIYNNRQAYPKYIITYETSTIPAFPLLPATQDFMKTTVRYSRECEPNDPYQNMYRYAEGNFYHMLAMKGQSSHKYKIKEIDIVQNQSLEKKFKQKKVDFTKSGIPDSIIWAFHGTDVTNIDSILRNNFQLSCAKRQVHGTGNYFSEFPDVSLGYGNGLLLCELLPGREYRGSGDYPSDYQSKVVDSDISNSSQMVIIRDCDQILPKFVIHLVR